MKMHRRRRGTPARIVPTSKMKLFETRYGYFDGETAEYVVTTPHTPLPWVNIICPGNLGIAISAAGDGFTWFEHARLHLLTRWIQDFPQQNWGKFIYLVDRPSGGIWSASYSPCKAPFKVYRAIHGIGYTQMIQRRNGLESRWLITVDPDSEVEVWSLELTNLSRTRKEITVVPYLEWCLGNGAYHHRQIHECFLRTWVDGKRILATRNM